MKKIKYEIEKYQDHYRLYKVIETSTGMNLIVKFTGTKDDCLKKKKEYEDEEKNNNRTNNSNITNKC